MLGSIVEINNSIVKVKLSIDMTVQNNLVGFHVVFVDGTQKIIGEITNVDINFLYATIIGEIKDNRFNLSATARPPFKANVRLIEMPELELILGNQSVQDGYTNIGTSNIYHGYKINVSINKLFDNHFAIIGNSGSGKSCTVASILQKIFLSGPRPPLNSNLVFFDTYGEYTNVFTKLHEINPNINYKVYTTNIEDKEHELFKIPIWLLDVDDLALLLGVTESIQLQVIEKMLRYVLVLSSNDEKVIIRKNDIIARALQDILLSGATPTAIYNQIVAVLTKFNTTSLNLNSQIVQLGYIRTLKQCLSINQNGKISEMELVMDFIQKYIIENADKDNFDDLNHYYTLDDLELALDFALINEGVLKSNQVFDYANVLKVRLHSLATGPDKNYFSWDQYITRDGYIDYLTQKDGHKCQIVNININDVSERFAKVFTKIISRMLLMKNTSAKVRGECPYHIIIEEAHRYVQDDIDVRLLGYNIFERIIKEGRKFGVFLILVTQRPNELSNAIISQCSNFIILKMVNPNDLQYIKDMIPNISEEFIGQLKSLSPGNCIAFGKAFNIPISLYIDIPDPRPTSNDVDLERIWYKDSNNTVSPVNSISSQSNLNNASDVHEFI